MQIRVVEIGDGHSVAFSEWRQSGGRRLQCFAWSGGAFPVALCVEPQVVGAYDAPLIGYTWGVTGTDGDFIIKRVASSSASARCEAEAWFVEETRAGRTL